MSELPSGWQYESIDSIVEGGLIADGDWVESKDQDPEGKVRLTQLADVGDGDFRDRSDRWMNNEQATRLNVNYLQPGDLLMARMPDPLGRTCMVPENIGRAVTVVDVAIIRITRKDINPKFIMWLLNSPGIRQQIEMLASGTTRRRITRKNLGTIDLPIPPIDEQHQIVEILEDHLSRLDAALSDVKQARAKAVQFKRSLLQTAFTGILMGREGAWKTSALGEICEKPQYGWTTSGKSEGEIKLLRTTDLTRGPLNWKTVPFCEEEPKDISKYELKSGDLLISRTGVGVGTSGIIEKLSGRSVFASYLIRLRIQTDMLPKYMFYFFQSPSYWSQIGRLKAGSAISNINVPKIQSIEIPVPSLDEQNVLVEVVEKRLSQLEYFAKVEEEIRISADSLRRSLLQAAFTGQLTREVTHV